MAVVFLDGDHSNPQGGRKSSAAGKTSTAKLPETTGGEQATGNSLPMLESEVVADRKPGTTNHPKPKWPPAKATKGRK
jgi:hypothetical protein